MAEQWAKVLYRTGGFPDNHTDSKFLQDLKHNLHFKPVDCPTAILKSARVSAQICITVIFWSVFLQLRDDNPCWQLIYSTFSLFMVVTYAISFGSQGLPSVVKSVVLFAAVGYASTPILKTLTVTISTDSIYAMSSALMLVQLVFHRYGMDGSCVSPYVSLNASICGAICLASRLPQTSHAFALLTLAVQAFALFPELYETLDFTPKVFVVSFTIALLCVTSLSLVAAALFLTVLVLVNVAFPLAFVWAQKYKKNIYGPWDEAMIPK